MKTYILLLLIVLIVQGNLLKSGDKIVFSCQKPEVLAVSNLRIFVVIISNISILNEVILKNDKNSCSMNSNNLICLFTNHRKKIDIVCKIKNQIELQIFECQQIFEGYNQIKTSTIYFENSGKNILKLKLNKQHMYLIKRISNKNLRKMFIDTNCIEFITKFRQEVYFGIKLKILTERQLCIIHVNKQIEGIWQLFQQKNNIKDKKSILSYAQPFSISSYSFDHSLKVNQIIINIKDQQLPINTELKIIIKTNQSQYSINLLTNNHYVFKFVQKNLLWDKLIVKFSIATVYEIYLNSINETIQSLSMWEYLYYFDRQLHNNVKVNIEMSKQIYHSKLQNLQLLSNGSIIESNILDNRTNQTHKVTIVQNGTFPFLNSTKYSTLQLTFKFINYFFLTLIKHQQIFQIQLNKNNAYYFYPNEVKKVILSQQINFSKILSIKLEGECLLFTTYNLSCSKIDCCQIQIREKDYGDLLKINLTALSRQLILYMKSSQQNYCSLIISQDQPIKYLTDGNYQKGILTNISSIHHYQYQWQKNSGLQIKCISDLNEVILLINIKQQKYPTLQQYQYGSIQSSIYINQNLAGVTVFISLYHSNYLFNFINNEQRGQQDKQTLQKTNKSIIYSILAIKQKSLVQLKMNEPLYENTMLFTMKSYLIRYPYYQMSKEELMLCLYIESEQHNNIEIIINSRQNWIAKEKQQKNLRYKLQNNHIIINLKQVLINACNNSFLMICQIVVAIDPKNIQFSFSIMALESQRATRLINGKYLSLSYIFKDVLYFYCKVKANRNVSLYVEAIGFEIQLNAQFVADKDWTQILNGEGYPQITTDNNSPDNIKAIKLTVSNKFKQFGYILITVKTQIQELQKNQLKILCTQEETYFYPSSTRIQYFLSEHQFHNILIDGTNLYFQHHQQTLISQIIYGHISMSISLIYNNKIQIFRNEFIQSFAISSILNKINFAKDIYTLILFKINITCLTNFCQIFHILTNNNTYHRLISGRPHYFKLEKHSYTIFYFSNYLDLQFKVKINRKQGSPLSKICSAKSKSNAEQCYLKLKQESQKQSSLVIEEYQKQSQIKKRQYQLQITPKHIQYCIQCTYLIALYSKYDIIEGEIFIMQNNIPVIVSEQQTIINIVERGYHDLYALKKSSKIQIYQITGTLNIHIIDSKTKAQFSAFSFSETQNILIENIPLDQYLLQISPTNNLPSSLYTISSISQSSQFIKLKDGIPYRMQSHTIKKQQYLFKLESQGAITLVLNKGNIANIKHIIYCTNYTKKYTDEKQLTISKYINKIANTIQLLISNQYCFRYALSIQNIFDMGEIQYIILALANDIVTLPISQPMPGILKYQQKLYQIYSILVTQKTELIFNIKFCKSSSGRIMVFSQRDELITDNYKLLTKITKNSTQQILKYHSKPGFIYLKIQFTDRQGYLHYTIEVNTYDTLTNLSISIVNPSISQFNINISHEKLFEINFYPIILQSKDNQFLLTYYGIQSQKIDDLKKVLQCQGNCPLDFNNQQCVKVTKLQIKENLKDKIGIFYEAHYSLSFFTIIPTITPKPHLGFKLPTYELIQLSKGKLIQKIAFKFQNMPQSISQFMKKTNWFMIFIIIFILIVSLWLLVITFCCCLYSILIKICGPRIVPSRLREVSMDENEQNNINEGNNELIE